MKVNIGNNEISYDGRKESLIISVMAQKYGDNSEFFEKINGELLEFAGLIPKMNPEHLAIVAWQAGYEFGHPMDYYGVGAIACSTIKPWEYHPVDHLIQSKKPFSKISGAELLALISLDHDSKKAQILEGQDDMYNYSLPQTDLETILRKVGFSCEFLPLFGEEDYDLDLDYYTDNI